MKTLRIVAAVAAVIASFSAHAVSVTSLSGSTTYSFAPVNLFTTGPETVAPGITWSSDTSWSVYGWTNGYGFAGNGSWYGLSMIGSNSPTATMRIDFASAVSGVGAFLNYAAGYGDPATIAVYDSSNSLIESYTLGFSTGGGTNTGEFHGFSESSANISYMTLSGSYIGAADLQVVQAPAVPEPETYALMLGGLGALGFVARRRKSA
jgi:hypothetical protein